MHPWYAALIPALFVAPHSAAPAPHALIAAAVAAAGGIDALRGIKTYRVVTQNEIYNIGQEDWPGEPAPTLTQSLETAVVDHERSGFWIRDQRLPISGVLSSTRVLVPGLGIAYIALAAPPPTQGGAAGSAPRTLPPGHLAEVAYQTSQRSFRYSIPDRLLVDAFDAAPASLRLLPVRNWHGRMLTGVATILRGDTLQLWFDNMTHHLAGATWQGIDLTRGKLAPVETGYWYANWAHAGATWLPLTTVMTVDGAVAASPSGVSVEVNPAGVDTLFTVDPKFTLLAATRNTSVTKVNEVAPGIFRLEGVVHTPLAVQQGDSIILLEAPNSPEFVHSMLDSLHARFPQSRVTTFVVTHHHADHIAGVPTAFDAGLRAIASADIAEYVRTLGVVPGTAPRHPRQVTAVRDSLVVGSGPARFVLYHVPTAHVASLMMAYFPEAKLLYDIDLAAGPPEDRQAEYDFIRAHHLDVANLSRIHGPVLPWAGFVKTVPDTT